MKKTLFFVVAFLAMTTGAFAQFAQSNVTGASTATKPGNIFSTMTTKDYNRFYLGYNPVSVDWTEQEKTLKKMFPMDNGLTLGYMRGINVVKSLPLYVEAGANLQYTFGSYDDKEKDGDYSATEEIKLNMFSLNVPVNLAFRFSFAHNDFSVTPYLGLNFRFNIAGTLKETSVLSYEYDDDEYKETIITKANLFSSDEPDFDDEDIWDVDEDGNEVTAEANIGMGDYALKRFQIGFNVGVAFNYKSLHFGIGYVTDFNKIANTDEDDYEFVAKLGVPTISLGIAF